MALLTPRERQVVTAGAASGVGLAVVLYLLLLLLTPPPPASKTPTQPPPLQDSQAAGQVAGNMRLFQQGLSGGASASQGGPQAPGSGAPGPGPAAAMELGLGPAAGGPGGKRHSRGLFLLQALAVLQPASPVAQANDLAAAARAIFWISDVAGLSYETCSSNQEFKIAMEKCSKLYHSYDHLESVIMRHRSRSRLSVQLTQLRTRLLTQLGAECGLSPSALESAAVERVRSREMRERCAGGTFRGRQPCGCGCGAVGDQAHFDWHSHPEATQRLHWHRGQGMAPQGDGGPERQQPELLTAWPVWRRGRGMLLTSAAPGLLSKAPEGVVAPAGVDDGQQQLPFTTSTSVLLQYWSQPDALARVVRSYAVCSNVSTGERMVPEQRIPMELLVNADQPGESHVWVEQWRSLSTSNDTTGGSNSSGSSESIDFRGIGDKGFLFVIFNHNVHENRGFDTTARASNGDLLVLTQDDDLSPPNCQWAARVGQLVQAHPRVAGVGYWGSRKFGGPFSHFSGFWASWGDTMLDDSRGSGITSDYVELIDVGPMIIMSCAWMEIGGFDEGMGPLGQTGIISDWYADFALWMAGYRIMAIQAAGDLGKVGAGVVGGTHRLMTVGNIWRDINQFLNGAHYGRFTQQEVFPRPEIFRISHNILQPLNRI